MHYPTAHLCVAAWPALLPPVPPACAATAAAALIAAAATAARRSHAASRAKASPKPTVTSSAPLSGRMPGGIMTAWRKRGGNTGRSLGHKRRRVADAVREAGIMGLLQGQASRNRKQVTRRSRQGCMSVVDRCCQCCVAEILS